MVKTRTTFVFSLEPICTSEARLSKTFSCTPTSKITYLKLRRGARRDIEV